jgi:hypothetical protein
MRISLEGILRRLALRLALRALDHARRSSWYLEEVLRNRLAAGLATPAEVLAAIGAWKAAAKHAR